MNAIPDFENTFRRIAVMTDKCENELRLKKVAYVSTIDQFRPTCFAYKTHRGFEEVDVRYLEDREKAIEENKKFAEQRADIEETQKRYEELDELYKLYCIIDDDGVSRRAVLMKAWMSLRK